MSDPGLVTANEALMTPGVQDDDASIRPGGQPNPQPSLDPQDQAFGGSWLEKWLRRFARPLLAIYWPLLLFSTHSKMPESVDRAMEQVKYLNPDKFLHFGTYGPLMLLLVLAAPLGRKASFIANLGFACLLLMLYGVIDEITQGYFDRTPSAADLMADYSAAAIVFLVLMWSHPSRRTTPLRLLISRTLLAVLIPLAGIALFQNGFGLGLWRWLTWQPIWIRGDVLDHFVCAFLLFWLLLAAAPLGDSRAKTNFIAVFAAMLAMGPTVEWLQTILSQRGAELEDILSHTAGVLTGAGLWLLISLFRKRRHAEA